MTIHHATTKKANKAGLVIQEVDHGFFVVTQDGKQLAEGTKANDVLAAALAKIAPEPKAKKAKAPKAKKAKKKAKRQSDGEDDEEGEEEAESKSVITAKYKKKYRPNKDTCGDALVSTLREFLHPDGEDTDSGRFYALAKVNGIDGHSWDHLKSRTGAWNVGMARMNLGNKLRGMVNRGQDVKIGSVTIKGKPGAK